MIEGNISRMGDMDNELPFMLNELLYVPEEENHEAITSSDDAKRKDG